MPYDKADLDTNYTNGWDPKNVIGWDTETAWDPEDPEHAPPPVCLTMAGFAATAGAASELENLGALVRWDGLTWEALVNDTLDMASAFNLLRAASAAPAHHLPYDYTIAQGAGWMSEASLQRLVEEGLLRDTKVREMLYCIATDNFNFDARLGGAKTKFSLAYTVQVRLDKDRSAQKGPDTWRTRYRELSGIPWQEWPQEAIDYAIEDAADARDVFIHQGTPMRLPEGVVVDTSGNLINEKAQTLAAIALHYMSAFLPGVNPDKVERFAAAVQAQVAEAIRHGTQAGIYRINKCKSCEGTGLLGHPPRLYPCRVCEGDPSYIPPRARVSKGDPTLHKARLQAWVRHKLGDFTPMTEPSKTYPKGQVKTDTDTVKMTAEPVLVAWAEGQEAQKDLTTYVPILRRVAAKQRVLTRPNVLVRSGRTSWRDFNMQNPTARTLEDGLGFRECFEADDHHIFASIDYKSVEMVTFAQTCLDWFGHSRLAEVINKGYDPHAVFAGFYLGLSMDEAMRRYKAGDPDLMAIRKGLAKVGNFGLLGGMGATSLKDFARAGFGMDITLEEAEHVKEVFLGTWPEAGEFFNRISNMANQGLPDRYGKQRFNIRQEPTGRIRGGAHYTSACNTMFQGRAADLAKAAMWELHKRSRTGLCPDGSQSMLHGVRVWSFVHDEFLFHGPEMTAYLWAQEAVEVMEQWGQPFVPDVKLVAVPALCRFWTKGMEPVYNNENLLVAWTPEEAS